MSGSWYLIKNVPDLFRNEPTNVGVVVIIDGKIASRFVGERADGTIDGRRLPRSLPPLETYRAWVDFIRREAEAGNLDERVKRLARRHDHIVIERRGSLIGALAEESPRACVDDLYAALVDAESDILAAPVEEAAQDLLKRLNARIEQQVVLRVEDKGIEHDVPFDYRYTNGQVTLMDRLRLGGRGRQLDRGVNDLLFRIHLAEHLDVRNFLVLHAGGESQEMEDELHRIERYANTVDLTRSDALETVAAALQVGILPESRSEVRKVL